jgi:hypothetical protein
MSRRAPVVLVAVLVALGLGVAYFRGAFAPRDGATPSTGASAIYQCAMHPQIVSDHPGNCPICQMPLQRVDEAALHTAEAPRPARAIKFYRHPMRPDVVSDKPAKDEMGMDYLPVYDDEDASGDGAVPGHAAFTLSPERRQIIGVTRDRVARRALAIDVHAVGRVAYDPALYRAIVDYREAVRSRGLLGSARDEARSGGDALVHGAYLRLRQQGLSDAQVQTFVRADRDPVELLLPGDAVWIYAQVYEYEAPLVEVGQTMEVAVPALPGRTFSAKIGAIDPILDPATRTVRIRALVATPDKDLRPESFVRVTIHVPLGDRLAVPSQAVLDTGRHQIVFVVTGDGRFEPRAVTLGRSADGFDEVLAGLAEGDEVVTSANFLIDSESRFRAAVASFKRPDATP